MRFILLFFLSLFCADANETLKAQIARMVVVGFNASVLDANSSIVQTLQKYPLGGVILFDKNYDDRTKTKNIASPAQLKALTDALKSHAKAPLLIGVDQEGGKVARLKPAYGFTPIASAHAIAQTSPAHAKEVYELQASMRQTYAPGETMFVDYSGSTLNVHNTLDGTTSKAQIFVAVLGASGMTFVHATASQKQEDFILSHLKAFSFYGGVAHFTTPDNLKSAVISHKKGVVVLNESYEEMARHFDTVIQPARPYKPKDKAKAEQGVLGIQRWILAQLRHQTFFSIDEINQAIAPLLDRYNAKVIKRLGKSRTELFEEVEKTHLKPLPSNRYVYREFKSAIVDLGYHVQLHKCFYSVPYTHLKAKVEIAYSATTVWVLLHSEVIATHPRIFRAGEYATQENHMPPQHLYSQQAMNPQRLLKWAKEIGGYAEIFVEHRLVSVEYPPNAYKSLIAILKLAKQYGNNELNATLQYASSRSIHSYRSIESILAKKLYVTLETASIDAQITYSPVAHRGSSYYC